MAAATLQMIAEADKNKYPSQVLKEYYEVIREMVSIVLLLDGFKTVGEGAHNKQIDYLKKYKDFSQSEIKLMDNLRIIRNRVSYDGFFVKEDYIDRKLPDVLKIIEKLKKITAEKIKD